MRPFLMIAALMAATSVSGQTVPASPAPPASATPGAPSMAGGNPEARAEARAKLIAADTNKDGKWDKVEWTAAGRREQGFALLDTNGDGFITQAELEEGRARMRARRTPA